MTEHLHAQGFNNAVLQLGLPDEFIDHGDPALLLKNLGLDAQGIETSIKQHYGELFVLHGTLDHMIYSFGIEQIDDFDLPLLSRWRI